MDEEERKRKSNTRNVLLIFAFTVLAAVVSIGWFMVKMISKT